MRTLTIILSLLLIAQCFSHAQNTGKISGKITDQESRQILEGATISALNESTGIFIRHSVSGKKGDFTIGGLPVNTRLEIIVSFTGYRDSSLVLSIPADKRTLNTGEWKMRPAGNELEEVIITARKPPFIVKKDTLEFNASAFKSLPNDMVQDLLRKLPGIVMDEQGNITINGRKVNKIKVDGRDFFGGNLKMATENLPGTIIDKVQVYETRERGEENRSIIQPVGKDLTLNLTLQKNKRKGVFGFAGGGIGTEERYNANAMINAFNEGKRLSLFGNAGNTNNMRGMGGRGVAVEMFSQGGDGGIIKNATGGGINFNNDLGKKGRVDASYMMENNNRENITNLERTNILPDSSFLYNSNARSNTINHNHRLNAEFAVEMDSLQTISISPSISYSENMINGFTDAASTTVKGDNINSQQNRNLNKHESFTLNNRFYYSRSSADRKTNFALNWNFDVRQGRGDQSNLSKNIFYNNIITRDSLDQSGNISSNGISNNISLNINREIVKGIIGILNYTFMQNGDNYDKDVFNLNTDSGAHDLLDSTFSIHNKNTGITHLPTASIGYRGKKFSAEFGAGMRFIKQDNKIIWKDSTITVDQQNFTPRTSISYRLNKNSQFTANYMVNSNQPTPEQLAPVQDNTNPLYIKVGNPFLKSSVTHQFSSEIRYFTRDYKWHAAVSGSGSVTNNQIVPDAYYDTVGRQISTFQNVNGAKQFNAKASFGSRVRFSEWNFTFDVSSGVNTNKSIGFVNRQQNNSSSIQFNPQVQFGMNYKNNFFFHTNAGINFNSTENSLDGINDISFNTKNIMCMSRWMPVKRLGISASVFYIYNSQLPVDFQRARTLVNSSVSYNFLKNERLSVGIGVNDILNNNISVTRTVTPNAIENTQVNALRRYAMLTVNYRLSDFNRNLFF